MHNKCRGTITVFLTLIMIVIVALIGTIVDVTRVQIGTTYANRALVNAMESQFTEYCKELYEDYHIFLLQGEKNMDTMSDSEFKTSIQEYLLYAFEPEKYELYGNIPAGMITTNILDIELEECNVDEKTSILEYEGELFLSEVTEYMKYYAIENLTSSVLENLNVLEQSKKTMEVMKEKMKVDEKAAKLDRNIQKLISEVEGLTFKNGGLVVKEDYTLKTEECFVKKFCIGEPRASKVGYNFSVIWDSLKYEYIDPLPTLKELEELLQEEEQKSALELLKNELEELNREVEERMNDITEYNSQETSTIQINPDKDEYLIALGKSIEEKEEEIKELEEKAEKSSFSSVKRECDTLIDTAKKMVDHTDRALQIITELQEERYGLLSDISDYESYLSGKKNDVPQEVYSGIQEEYEDLKNYLYEENEEGKDTSIVGDLLAMNQALNKNKMILEQFIELEDNNGYQGRASKDELKQPISDIIKAFETYEINTLKFDYSTLTVDPDVKSPVSVLSGLIGDGLLSLVVEEDESLSKEELKGNNLPTVHKLDGIEAVSNGEEENQALVDEVSREEQGVSGSLEKLESGIGETSVVSDVVGGITKRVLINEYATTFFCHYEVKNQEEDQSKTSAFNKTDVTNEKQEKNKQEILKDTVLEYEQEYLICGDKSDYENIRSIVMRTIFLRTVFNYMSLLADKTSRSEATIAATSIVGFTGFAPLILVVKQSILLTWAFEESIVDTSALLEGYRIPLIKGKNEISLKFNELLLINKQLIQHKVEAIGKKTISNVGMSYEDFLQLYMLLVDKKTIAYRMMDLIQTNMQLRYDGDFTLENGVFGVGMSMSCTMPGKFLRIPLVKRLSGYKGNNFNLVLQSQYSY